MDVEYRAITEDDFDAFVRVGRVSFGAKPLAPEAPLGYAHSELDRTRAAFVGGQLVGTGRNYSVEMTLPGAAVVPVAGLTWVSVLPSHRRSGVLTGLMGALRDDAVSRGEAISILTASEGGIYGRFGYGVATLRLHVHVDRAHSGFALPRSDDGRMRVVNRAEALQRFPAVYAQACRLRPGMVTRPELWWEESLFNEAPPSEACFFVIHEDSGGSADGFVVYEISGGFELGINRKHLQVSDLVAVTEPVRALLWQFAFSVDLVETIGAAPFAVDDPLRFLLADGRRLRVDAVNDHLWIQIVDVARALEARRYSSAECVTLEVHDGAAVTRVQLDGGPDGARCTRTAAPPDLVLGLSQLGSIYLGGVRAEQLAAAGTIEERTTGAVRRVDAMFASYPSPVCLTWD